MTSTEPRIVAFLCNWCTSAAADLAGTVRMEYPPNILPIRVMCTGFVDPSYVLRALLEGANGVLVGGCRPGDCHYVNGNLKARRKLAALKEELETLGLDARRVRLEWISASDAKKFVETVKGFTAQLRKLGSSEISRLTTG